VLLGFREVAAGLLWVRSEEYFHTGKYEELVPMFYIVTWLDPHQIDVYSTGAWHLAYNLGDGRLIPEGVKFLNEGIKNNPELFDLYFQQSWLHSNKVRDYPTALQFVRQAATKKSSDGERAPHYVFSQIAHNLEDSGRIPEMIRQWETNVNESWKQLYGMMRKKAKGTIRTKLDAFQAAAGDGLPKVGTVLADGEIDNWVSNDAEMKLLRDALSNQIHNLNTNYLRRDFFRKGVGQPGYRFDWNANPPRWVNVGDGKDYRQDTKFDFKVTKIAPRKLKVTGHLEGADFYNRLGPGRMTYTRLNVLFRDKNYEQLMKQYPDFDSQKANITWYRNDISFPTQERSELKPGERSTEFEFILDFSKDPETDWNRDPKMLYPLKSDEFELTVQLDPSFQSPFQQDFFGWKGEGLKDSRYLVVDERGVRVIRKTVTLKRSDVL
jgi:hypothetical protein